MSFLQRFGSALNEHWHYHCCVSDGGFVAADGQNVAFVSAAVDADGVASAVQCCLSWAYRCKVWTMNPSPPNETMMSASVTGTGGSGESGHQVQHGPDHFGSPRRRRAEWQWVAMRSQAIVPHTQEGLA